MKILKDRLKKARENAKLTQADLARISYVSKYKISNIERGLTERIKPEDLKLIADALMITEDYLIGESDEKHKNRNGLTKAMYDIPQWDWEIQIKRLLKENSINSEVQDTLKACVDLLRDTEFNGNEENLKTKVLNKTIEFLSTDNYKAMRFLSDFLDILEKNIYKER